MLCKRGQLSSCAVIKCSPVASLQTFCLRFQSNAAYLVNYYGPLRVSPAHLGEV